MADETNLAPSKRAALEEIVRLRTATDEGSLAKRADRMWEVACEALGRPVPGATPLTRAQSTLKTAEREQS